MWSLVVWVVLVKRHGDIDYVTEKIGDYNPGLNFPGTKIWGFLSKIEFIPNDDYSEFQTFGDLETLHKPWLTLQRWIEREHMRSANGPRSVQHIAATLRLSGPWTNSQLLYIIVCYCQLEEHQRQEKMWSKLNGVLIVFGCFRETSQLQKLRPSMFEHNKPCDFPLQVGRYISIHPGSLGSGRNQIHGERGTGRVNRQGTETCNESGDDVGRDWKDAGARRRSSFDDIGWEGNYQFFFGIHGSSIKTTVVTV